VTSSSGRDPGAFFTYDTVLQPWALFDQEGTRRFDVGVGYLGRQDVNPVLTHGAFVEWTTYVHFDDPGSDLRRRLGINIAPELLFVGDLRGYGATLSLDLEVFNGIDTTGAKTGKGMGLIGVGLGEGGVGLSVAFTAQRIDDQDTYLATAGLTLRVPLAAGIIIAPQAIIQALTQIR